MDRVVANHQEERFLFLVPSPDKSLCFISLAVGEIFSFFAPGEIVDSLSESFVSPLGLIEGVEVTGRLTIVAAPLVFIITLSGRKPRGVTKVPLSNVAAAVAPSAECFGN